MLKIYVYLVCTKYVLICKEDKNLHPLLCNKWFKMMFVFCLQALAIMEVAHGKDHHYVAEVKREIEEQN